MLLEMLFTLIAFASFGFFKLTRIENGERKYERFFKSPAFPEFILLAYFLSLIIRALFLPEMSYYLSTTISLVVILALFVAARSIWLLNHYFLNKMKNKVTD